MKERIAAKNAEMGTFVVNKHKKYNYYVMNFYILDGINDNGNKEYLNLGVIPKPSVKSMAIEFRSTKKEVRMDQSLTDIL